MRTVLSSIGLVVMMALACAQPFTYQGLLKQNGTPANGTYQMTFRLYDVASGGAALGTVGPLSVSVANGLFSVELNFPASVWDGGLRYLEIQVGGTTLTPRVKINPTPYASAIRMFESGTSNPDRMVIAHSPAFSNWGLQYQDALDKFNFLAGGIPVMTVDLGGQRVGIGTSSPASRLHIVSSADTALFATTTSGFAAVDGRSSNSTGRGVFGWTTATTGVNFGVFGQSDSDAGIGVYGWATATSGNPTAILGRCESPNGRGVFGLAVAASGGAYGVWGESWSTSGVGVVGYAPASSGNTAGVSGTTESTSGVGVYGAANATSGTNYGVYGVSNSPNGTGVYGFASATSGTNYGVYGWNKSPYGSGVFGRANIDNQFGGHGVYSWGNFAATGNKSFQIDHPLHPETHFLNHFCTEGPDPMNAYSGMVVLDARGEAWVQLPDYFDSINRDPRYTLTPVGAPMPNLHVAVEIQNNRFKIAGGVPGKKVSWRVEAIRNDRWEQQHGYQTEQEKPKEYQGKYLHPELYGQPKERGIFYRPELEQPREGEKPK